MKLVSLRSITIVLLVLGSEAMGGPSAEAQRAVSGEGANQVGVELLGRAGIYSVNYERTLEHRVGVGGGLSFLGGSGDHAVLLPLYVSWTPLGGTHRLYVSTGLTGAVSHVSLFGRSREYEAGVIGHASVGYEFTSGSGLVIRPTANYFFGHDSGVWWPGITIGARF